MAHNEHGRVESNIEVLKEFFTKSGDLGKKHSYLEWETIFASIASTINGFPICHNQDDPHADDTLGLITPNMFLIGRNKERAPEGFVEVECDPVKALQKLKEYNTQPMNLLGRFCSSVYTWKKASRGSEPRPP